VQSILSATGAAADISFNGQLATADTLLPGFLTLDKELQATIEATLATLAEYVGTPTVRRPCNFIMVAEPGSGKSHFVRCLGEHCRLPPVIANVASLDRIDDLVHWLDEARNYKAADRIPLLFIDEADAKPEALAAYLPLLWDGTFFSRGRDLEVGRCAIVLAASDPGVLKKIDNPDEPNPAGFPKLNDFLSRVNGGLIRFSPIDERRTDKVCLAASLLLRRHPSAKAVNLGLLKLAVNTSFLHSVRSMETLIGYFPPPDAAGVVKNNPAFEMQIERFLAKKSFRENLFSFHLSGKERINANATWIQFKDSTCTVWF